MYQRRLGNQFEVSALGLGCMGMSEFYGQPDDKQSLQVLHRAMELGINFLDTADMYGPHLNEELIGQFLKQNSAPVKIATKFGIVRKQNPADRTFDNSPEYARSACEQSLKRLGIDCIDLYYVHRIDQRRPIEETMQVLSKLVEEGKIKHIGLCEVSAATLRRAHAVHPVTALQTEYSLWTRDVEAQILPTCQELEIGFVPYSPLGRGFLTDSFNGTNDLTDNDFRRALPRFADENAKANGKIVTALNRLAKTLERTSAQIALAWLLSKGDNIVPIPGTKRIRYLEENVAAVDIQLGQQALDELEAALSSHPVAGERYSPMGMKGLNA